jgi:hypothetical protein
MDGLDFSGFTDADFASPVKNLGMGGPTIGWGDALTGVGLSMMSSTDRRQPFNFGVLNSALNSAEQDNLQSTQASAIEAALIQAGVPPDQARTASRSPNAANIMLQLQNHQRQQANAGAISPLWGGGGGSYAPFQ